MKYEIWLGNDPMQFERGIAHLDDGSTKELMAWHNSSTYHEGSILVDEVGGRYDGPVRWYPKPGVVEFYSWDGNITEIIFHNDSKRDYYIFGYAYLKPGETAVCDGKTKPPHRQLLRRFNPKGLATLQNTSHSEPEYQTMIGREGVLLERLSYEDVTKDVWKFLLPEVFRNEDPELEGFETSAGHKTFANGAWTLHTDHSEYTITF